MASTNTDVDMTSKSQTGSVSRLYRHESDHNMTQILSEGRSIRLVLYGSTPVESEHRFWIDTEVTFGGVAKVLTEMYPSQELVVLQANWGPRPYWTESHPDSPIGSTCRALYALLKDQAKPYTMGVVRTSRSDYPIPIYVPASKSSTTLLEAVIASYPKLTGQVKSIVLHFEEYDLQDDPWDNSSAQCQPYPAAPLFITTLDEPSKEFLAGSLYEAFSPLSPNASTSNDSDALIPPLLQISFAECKLLIQRAYDLDAFPLQMIHLSEAIFHVVISLARSLNPVFENNSSSIGDVLSAEDDLANNLRVAPLLCRQLEELLDSANGIMDDLELGRFNREEAQHAIEKIFATLCGDLPGAMTVRCSENDFKKFSSIDCQEWDTLAIDKHKSVKTAYPEFIVEDRSVANVDPILDIEYHSDAENLPDPSSQPDWWFLSARRISKAANILWYPNSIVANPTATSGVRSRPLTPNSEAQGPIAYPPASPYLSPRPSPRVLSLGGGGLPPGPHSPNPEVIGTEKAGEGICIVSFDGGGPGSLSQLRMLDELMLRLAFKPGTKLDELYPADYFDLMGGVGFGGLVALLLGRLRMTTSQAMEELAEIGTATFPEGDATTAGEVNMARLRNAIESMLERHGHPADIHLHDSSENRCKVVVFAAPTVAIDHCHPFRTYPAHRKRLTCTFVDAACAAIAIPEYFSSVDIGPRLRKQSFAGIPRGFDNPMREVLKESQLVFGETNPVSLVLSLGSGQRARPSDLDQHVTRSGSIHCDGVARNLQHQLSGVAEYLRLNVDNGMESIELDDWSKLGSIEDHTEIYLEMSPITRYIDRACQWLEQRNGSVTLGQLTGTNTDCVVKFHSETLKDYLAMEFKEMHNVVQQSGNERIILVDAIGNNIPIPTQFCRTYTMLSEVIGLYFKHQKPPGSNFVERGDYRLVHGNRKNIIGPMEWTHIDKAGLKVEMSMILRTRNAKCPSCGTFFEGSAIGGWAQCVSCSTQFQIEPQVWSEDTTQAYESSLTELMTPAVRESQRRERTSSGEAEQLQFRLISVINFKDIPFSHPPGKPRAKPGLRYEAEKGELYALERQRGILGGDHPDTIRAAENLAATYLEQRRYRELEELQVGVLEQQRRMLGRDHPATFWAAAHLVVTYETQGRWSAAEKLQVEVLKQRKIILGTNARIRSRQPRTRQRHGTNRVDGKRPQLISRQPFSSV